LNFIRTTWVIIGNPLLNRFLASSQLLIVTK